MSIVLAGGMLGATARAEPGPPARTPISWKEPFFRWPSRWARTRLFAAVGARIGSFTVNGDSTGLAIPLHVDLGVRRDRWAAFASYDAFGISADGSGLAHRLGAAGRYTLSRFAENDVGLDFWCEAGIGVERLRWDAGGTLTRADAAFGIGATLLYLDHRRHAGITAGLRITIAPRADSSSGPPGCGGPCDTATPPASFDRSFLFDVTVPFGT